MSSSSARTHVTFTRGTVIPGKWHPIFVTMVESLDSPSPAKMETTHRDRGHTSVFLSTLAVISRVILEEGLWELGGFHVHLLVFEYFMAVNNPEKPPFRMRMILAKVKGNPEGTPCWHSDPTSSLCSTFPGTVKPNVCETPSGRRKLRSASAL